MHWFLASPDLQQSLYWLDMINRSKSSMRKDFNCERHLSVAKLFTEMNPAGHRFKVGYLAFGWLCGQCVQWRVNLVWAQHQGLWSLVQGTQNRPDEHISCGSGGMAYVNSSYSRRPINKQQGNLWSILPEGNGSGQWAMSGFVMECIGWILKLERKLAISIFMCDSTCRYICSEYHS